MTLDGLNLRIFEKTEKRIVIFRIRRRCAIWYRNATTETGDFDGQLVAFALNPDERLFRLNVVEPVQAKLTTSFETKMLRRKRPVLPIDQLAIAEVGEDHGFDVVLNLRHVRAAVVDSIAGQHRLCDATSTEPIECILRNRQLWARVGPANFGRCQCRGSSRRSLSPPVQPQ